MKGMKLKRCEWSVKNEAQKEWMKRKNRKGVRHGERPGETIEQGKGEQDKEEQVHEAQKW